MTIRDRIRDWLGMRVLAHNIETFTRMLNNLELREKQRHEDTLGMLNRVEQRLINAHAFDKPQYSPAQLDWDTVQAIAMQQLRDNPEKEN